MIKICLRTCDMTSRSYFGKQNSTLGSVVPLAMFLRLHTYPVHDIHLTRRSKRRSRRRRRTIRVKNEEDNDDLVLVRGSGALGRYSSRQPGGESLALSFTIYTTIIVYIYTTITFYFYNLHHLLYLHHLYYLHHFHHLHYPHH